MFSNIILILLSTYLPLYLAQDFTYEEQDIWDIQFPTCGGRRQSPININTNLVRRDESLRLHLHGYNRPVHFKMFNDGHTVHIIPNSKENIVEISGSAVGKESVSFVLEELHFHWGDDNLEGTEHSINNNFGSAELHLVHFNKKYGNLINARERSDGIVVLTVLLILSTNDNIVLQPIIDQLRSIREYNTSATIERALILEEFLPLNKELFFRYKGSLTTPPCSESVTFIIFTDSIGISSDQLSQFRHLLKRPNRRLTQRIARNTRVRQLRNGRIIQISEPRIEDRIFKSYTNDNNMDNEDSIEFF